MKKNRTLNLELLYLDRCTAWHQTLENLKQALQSEGVALTVSLTRVVGARHARALRFQGCPAIRLDGEDIFYERSAQNGLACRLYSTGEGLKGWPTVRMILQRLRALHAFQSFVFALRRDPSDSNP
jgi:hypothetical protein